MDLSDRLTTDDVPFQIDQWQMTKQHLSYQELSLSYGKTIIRKPRNVAYTRTCKSRCCCVRKKLEGDREPFFPSSTKEKIDELACFLLCLPKKQKIRELCYTLDPLISPFRTHGGPVDTPIWTDNSIL